MRCLDSLRSDVERKPTVPMQRWYLLRTKPAAESRAEVHLGRQGYVAYAPRLVLPQLRRGRWLDHVVPLFPGYLFLRLDEGRQPLAPVRSTVGVARIVRFGGEYAIVPESVIRDLRARADPSTGLHRLRLPDKLAPGAGVRVVAGPFAGLDGIFERECGDERAIILLSVLGQAASVRVPVSNLAARPAPWAAS